MLAQSSHPWKVNFCKFTNETRNGIEDATANSGQTWIAARQRHRGGRRLRDGAGVRPDPAGRRQLLGRLAARGAAAGRAARHRRADPGHRQAPGPQGPRRRVRHDAPRASRGKQAVEWKLVDEVDPQAPVGRDGAPSAPPTAAAASTAPPTPAGVALPPLERDEDRRRHHATATSTAAFDRDAGLVEITVLRPGGRRARHRRAGARAGRRLLAAGHDPRARRPDPAAARQRAGAGHLADPHEGRRRGRAGVRAGHRASASPSRATTGWSTRSATTSSACSSAST